jgi:hypothetical protein
MTKRTKAEIEDAVARLDEWAETLDADDFKDIGDLRAVAEAAGAVKADQARLREAVEVARSNGHSWNRIAIALGVSRQAARERFAERVPAR